MFPSTWYDWKLGRCALMYLCSTVVKIASLPEVGVATGWTSNDVVITCDGSTMDMRCARGIRCPRGTTNNNPGGDNSFAPARKFCKQTTNTTTLAICTCPPPKKRAIVRQRDAYKRMTWGNVLWVRVRVPNEQILVKPAHSFHATQSAHVATPRCLCIGNRQIIYG